jgi:hypothetical protein
MWWWHCQGCCSFPKDGGQCSCLSLLLKGGVHGCRLLKGGACGDQGGELIVICVLS